MIQKKIHTNVNKKNQNVNRNINKSEQKCKIVMSINYVNKNI